MILLLGARLNWILHFGKPPRFDDSVKVIQVLMFCGNIHVCHQSANVYCILKGGSFAVTLFDKPNNFNVKVTVGMDSSNVEPSECMSYVHPLKLKLFGCVIMSSLLLLF